MLLIPSRDARPSRPNLGPGAPPSALAGTRRVTRRAAPLGSAPCVLALALLLLPSVARAAESLEQPLLSLVPGDAAAVWSWRSGPGSAPLEAHLETTLDAFVEARFDSWVFETADVAGVPPELLREVAAIRNVLVTVGAVVPWRELLRGEVVLARCGTAPLGGGADSGRGLLLMSRPDPEHLELIEAGLSSMLGALAGTIGGPVRYDIVEHDDLGTSVYQLTLRGPGDKPLVQAAIADGIVLLGSGKGCLDGAAALLAGGEGPRLIDTPRFGRDLPLHEGRTPADAAGVWFVDVQALAPDAGERHSMLAGRGVLDGPWQALLADALRLPEALDSISGTLRCHDDELVSQTVTRFSPDAPPAAIAGLAAPIQSDLMAYIPGDAIAFTMRGRVDLAPVWQSAMEGLVRDWPAMEEVLWMAELAQATLDLWVERDVLPWLGSAHVAMTLPSRSNPSAKAMTDTVVLFQLEDRDGAASCLRRIDGVMERVLPRVAERLRSWASEAELPFSFDVSFGQAEGMWRSLRTLRIQAGPIPVPPLTYGLVGNLLVFTTSEHALTSCMSVAAGEEDGLEVHPLLSQHVGRDDLTSLQLHPLSRELAGTQAGLASLDGMLRGLTGQITQDDPKAAAIVEQVSGLFRRVETVLATLDYLGDAVTVGTRAEGGLVRRQRASVQLVLAEQAAPTPLAAGSR
ncbi:MAG: hypothetical protein DRQ55_08625 [Planctomycetota bacterium]|nr:MAG: hypothetical protein DRQ55_08625 [Planctomycetota bacterium]